MKRIVLGSRMRDSDCERAKNNERPSSSVCRVFCHLSRPKNIIVFCTRKRQHRSPHNLVCTATAWHRRSKAADTLRSQRLRLTVCVLVFAFLLLACSLRRRSQHDDDECWFCSTCDIRRTPHGRKQTLNIYFSLSRDSKVSQNAQKQNYSDGSSFIFIFENIFFTFDFCTNGFT